MSELLKAFDSCQDFSRHAYYTLVFDAVSSTLSLEVPLKETKENLHKVIRAINPTENNYELVFKIWNTEDTCNADSDKDFPYELLFKSLDKKALIWILLDNDTLSVDFLYDCHDMELEKWITRTNDLLRKQFGLSRGPTFNVLIRAHGHFGTEEVRIEPVKFNLAAHYNDDFIEVSESIKNAISKKQSGLILLYGTPGTGKTTFIKSLISENQTCNFIFVQNEFVHNLLDPDFIAFLLKQRNAILVIEDAEKVIISREKQGNESVVSTILQLTDGLFSDYLNIKVICTFNSNLSKIDAALLRKGRMIAMYEFKPLCIAKTNKLLNELGLEAHHQALTVADIYNHTQKGFSNPKSKPIGFTY